MAIPHALVGDDIKQFKGARNVIKYLPSASGSTVGPNSSLLFTIPAEPYGYIKPNSMYLRGTVSIIGDTGHRGLTNSAGTTAAVGDATTSYVSFAGNTFTPTTATNAAAFNGFHGTGGASSVFNRITVTLPGGCAMSYNQQQHYRNAVSPHTLDAAYFNDLRVMESAGCTFPLEPTAKTGAAVYVVPAVTATAIKEINFCSPVDVPLFNADAAFPMLLCSQGITMEIVTSSLSDAIYLRDGTLTGGNATARLASVSSFAISNLALVYEVIQVTPEFKNALVASKAGSPYVIHVDDRMVIGPIGGGSATTRVNVGVGLSSLKSVLFAEALIGTGDVKAAKVYPVNGLTAYNIYRDGQQISIPNTTSEDICFMEMQRAIGRVNDSQTSSMIQAVTTSQALGVRSTYSEGGFLLGCSFQCIDDWSFSARGAGCDQLAVEVIKGTIDGPKWGSTTAAAASNLYIFCMYDSVVVILGDGTCQVRK
jgi:hypothetical protein